MLWGLHFVMYNIWQNYKIFYVLAYFVYIYTKEENVTHYIDTLYVYNSVNRILF